MGRELFDYAFKEYAKRWAFKHPTPADFFRTMEDASAVDLDWFWRGWFFSTEPVDIALNNVKSYRINSMKPAVENVADKASYDRNAKSISSERNKAEGMKFAVEQDTSLLDFYNKFDRFEVSKSADEQFQSYYNALSADEKKLYESKKNFYELEFANLGGLVMPLVIEWTFSDGSKEIDKIPAYIWRKNEYQVTKVFAKDKEVVSVQLDPYRETADIDEANNSWPRKAQPSRFEIFKQQQAPRGSSTGSNPMREARQR